MPTGWCCASSTFIRSQLRQFQTAAESGRLVRAFGEVRRGFFGAEMAHPRYRIVGEGEPLPQALTPIYPTTAGLSQAELRAYVLEALDAASLDDTLPEALRQRLDLADFGQSVQLLHRPPPGTDLGELANRTHPAWRRVKFDELLAQQLSMRFAYRRRRTRQAPVLKVNGPLLKFFLERLPFRLTKAQTRAMNEVLHDLREPHPMQRLLQGDVGSGKTVVAAHRLPRRGRFGRAGRGDGADRDPLRAALAQVQRMARAARRAPGLPARRHAQAREEGDAGRARAASARTP